MPAMNSPNIRRGIKGLLICVVLGIPLLIAAQTLEEPMALSCFESPDPFIKTYRLGFVGDIMMDRGVRASAERRFNGDYRRFFAPIQDRLLSYDVLFGNLEGPISDQGNDRGSIYSFRMDPAVAPTLKDVGFDILSLANNHAFDWGTSALLDTTARLSAEGIQSVGAGTENEAYSPRFISLSPNLTVAFLAFSQFDASYRATDTMPGVALIDKERIKAGIAAAKEKANLVVVSYHFGDEYVVEPTQLQRDVARFSIDTGADLVIGHHAHVVQPVEEYNGGIIAYGLGNFLFDQIHSSETMRGVILEVELDSLNGITAVDASF
jgi:poly-gamma-glutamate synthesis protein (capsule biosynthesis protein)